MFRECYANDFHTTTGSGVPGHHKRNARVFRNHATTYTMLVNKIKEEASIRLALDDAEPEQFLCLDPAGRTGPGAPGF